MKYLWLTLGFLFCGIGAIGVILPILPTTPFFLLSACCFARGSKKLHRWLLSTSLYKKHLHSFIENKTMTLKTKLCILLPASLMLGIAFLMMNNLYGRIVLILLVFYKYYYFFAKIKTISMIADQGA